MARELFRVAKQKAAVANLILNMDSNNITIVSFKTSSPIKPVVVTQPTKIVVPRQSLMKVLLPDTIVGIQENIVHIRKNLFKELFLHPTFYYPLTGIFEVLTKHDYWGLFFLSAICYATIFTIIGFITYILLLPLLIFWAVLFMGPIGVILAHIDWLVQTNQMTSDVCKNIILSRLNDRIFDMTLYLHCRNDFLTEAKYIKKHATKKPGIPWKQPRYWLQLISRYFLLFLKNSFMFILTRLIQSVPVLGTLIVYQLQSANIAFKYLHRYFILNGEDDKKNKEYEYIHLGHFICFGFVAGFIDLIPFVPLVTLTTNTVGAAQWAAWIIKEKSKK